MSHCRGRGPLGITPRHQDCHGSFRGFEYHMHLYSFEKWIIVIDCVVIELNILTPIAMVKVRVKVKYI
jgi:hypothetical protein